MRMAYWNACFTSNLRANLVEYQCSPMFQHCSVECGTQGHTCVSIYIMIYVNMYETLNHTNGFPHFGFIESVCTQYWWLIDWLILLAHSISKLFYIHIFPRDFSFRPFMCITIRTPIPKISAELWRNGKYCLFTAIISRERVKIFSMRCQCHDKYESKFSVRYIGSTENIRIALLSRGKKQKDCTILSICKRL